MQLPSAADPVDLRCPFDRTGLVRGAGGLLWYAGHPQTYVEVLQAAVRRRADSTAVIDSDGTELSYEALWNRATEIAGGLRRSGIHSGDRVAIDLGNSLPFVVTFLGTLLAGAIAVPMDQRGSVRSREAMLRDSEPALVIDASSPAPTGIPFVHEASPEDLAQMLYTSGTTGEPKGVMVNQLNLAALGEITRRVFRIDINSASPLRNLVAIPLCHAAGCNAQLLPTLALGGTAILTRSASTGPIIDMATRYQPDTILAVPAVYKLLAQREAAALQRVTSLRRLVYGAAPVAKSLIEELRALLPDVELGNAYGMTEISNMAMYLPGNLALSHHDSVGFPVPGVEVELRDQDEAGQGELHLRGPNMSQGYWRKPDITRQTFGSGWVRSGDVATVDEHGLVYVRDRAKDVINRGGEKIYTLEVENSLLSHPAVDESAVIAVPDDVMGEKVAAVVVLRRGSQATTEALTRHVAQTLPAYAVPEFLVVRRSALPRGGSGKILKAQLRRELGWGG